MDLPSLKDFSSKELLQLTGKILDELSARKIVRTNNNPVSGYTEWLVSQRLSAVSIPVSKGLFNVLLCDTNLLNMAPLAAAVFTHADVRVRIWFNDGASGFHVLSPDQRVAAVAYAMMADTVADGSITSAKLAPGAVGA